MKLIIAEKPSVAMQIASVVGNIEKEDGYVRSGDYLVSWCIGHLVGLSNPDVYDEKYQKWNIDDLPISPDKNEWSFDVKNGTKKQFKVLKDLINSDEVGSIIVATDAGREGELIFRLVYNKIGVNKPFERLWISSMEDSAIEDGFNNLKDGKDFDDLYESALSRSKADWLVGINATRLFTTKYHTKLSVGRVQTPTLSLIADRDLSIKNFIKSKYYNVELDLGTFKAKNDKIENLETSKEIKNAVI